MTYLYQIECDITNYLVGTDDKRIYAKLKNKDGFKLLPEKGNKGVWTFETEFQSPDKAQKEIEGITGAKAQIGSDGVCFFDPAYSVSWRKLKAPKGRIKKNMFFRRGGYGVCSRN